MPTEPPLEAEASEPTGPGSKWWRVAVAVALVVAVLGAGLVAWQRSDDSSSDTATTATTDATTDVTTDVASTYGVGRRDLTFVDPSRPTAELPDAGIAAQPDRTLATVILYPTENPDDDVSTDAAAAAGSFPLVVFSHGVGGNPEQYVGLVDPLAESGYVVVVPAFPLSSRSGSAVFDVLNQPADVSFVLDQVLGLSEDGSSWLGGRIDAERIAAAGHSLGAVTTVGLTYDACCRDDRIDAAVAISGIGLASGQGTLDDRPPIPLLLVHGGEDDVVPVSGSDTLFAEATGPVYYLRLYDADHTNLAFGEDGALTGEAVGAFLGAELKAEPDALAAMPEVVESSGRGEWRARNV